MGHKLSPEKGKTQMGESKLPKGAGMMDYDEATRTIDLLNKTADGVKDGLTLYRALLIDLHDREGWKAKNCRSFSECIALFFNQSARYVYRQLAAGRIEQELAGADGHGSGVKDIPERHLRTLSRLKTPELRARAWAAVVEETSGNPTQRAVEAKVQAMLAPPQSALPMEADEAEKLEKDSTYNLAWQRCYAKNGYKEPAREEVLAEMEVIRAENVAKEAERPSVPALPEAAAESVPAPAPMEGEVLPAEEKPWTPDGGIIRDGMPPPAYAPRPKEKAAAAPAMHGAMAFTATAPPVSASQLLSRNINTWYAYRDAVLGLIESEKKLLAGRQGEGSPLPHRIVALAEEWITVLESVHEEIKGEEKA